MPRVRLLLLCLPFVGLVGCASFIAPNYSADYESLDRLKATKPGKLQVAEVKPTDVEAPVNKISLRAARLESPDGTFSKYLEKAIARDLAEIGALDPKSDTRLDATMLKNEIDISGFGTGTGTMQVELTVTRGVAQRLRKVYRASTEFESSFAGAVAIPKGQAEYANLVRAFLKQVYTDPAFIAAIQP